MQRLAARLVGSPLFWVLFLVVAFGWPLVRVARTALPPPLPVLGAVPSFELVDQNGQPYGTGQLKGRVWLLSAIEIATPSADKLATEIGKIQHRVRNLGPAFHLVTIAVDPEMNDPARLLEFAGHHRVSPRMWSFLSGDVDATRRAAAAAGDRSLSVVLVDQQMRARGHYDLADPTAIDLLLYHAGLLVNRGD